MNKSFKTFLAAILVLLPALAHAVSDEEARLFARSRCLSFGFENNTPQISRCEQTQMEKQRAAIVGLSDADICKAVMSVRPAASYADARINIARCSRNPRAYLQSQSDMSARR